jgi:hypothetical protein
MLEIIPRNTMFVKDSFPAAKEKVIRQGNAITIGVSRFLRFFEAGAFGGEKCVWRLE